MKWVLNKYKDKIPSDAVWIMRPSELGNEFIIGRDGNRDEVVDKHWVRLKQRIKEDKEFRKLVKSLYRKRLVCCCAPLRCHGDNLVRMAKKLHKGVKNAQRNRVEKTVQN